MDSIGVATMSLSVVVGGISTISRGSRGEPGEGNEESEVQHLFLRESLPT